MYVNTEYIFPHSVLRHGEDRFYCFSINISFLMGRLASKYTASIFLRAKSFFIQKIRIFAPCFFSKKTG